MWAAPAWLRLRSWAPGQPLTVEARSAACLPWSPEAVIIKGLLGIRELLFEGRFGVARGEWGFWRQRREICPRRSLGGIGGRSRCGLRGTECEAFGGAAGVPASPGVSVLCPVPEFTAPPVGTCAKSAP